MSGTFYEDRINTQLTNYYLDAGHEVVKVTYSSSSGTSTASYESTVEGSEVARLKIPQEAAETLERAI